MPFPCGKRYITLVWCITECLFFSGLLNGWIWMQQLLKEDGYFLDSCNSSSVSKSLANNNAFIKPTNFTISQEGKTFKCFHRRVKINVPISEAENYLNRTFSSSQIKAHEVSSVAMRRKPNKKQMCDDQDNQLELVLSLIIIFRNLLMFPLGIFMDTYGTSRTRLVAIVCTAFGSLTMLFSGDAYPWLIFPALLMLGVSGMLLILTDLQIANMFGPRRYTVMSMFSGAYFSGGIVVFFMKLSKATGVSIQTSFMFITFGIVPVLISTIAMLPKSRIPWPMPAYYGKKKRTDLEDNYAKSKAWQRRISVGGKKRLDTVPFMGVIRSPLYYCMLVWLSCLSLKHFVFELNVDVHLRNLDSTTVQGHMTLFGMIMLLSLPMSPFIGVVMDWNKSFVQDPHVQQMRNILYAIIINYVISVSSSVTSMVFNNDAQIISFVLITIEKVTLHSTLFAFLTHVHFPGEHFGKSVGLAIACMGCMLVLQYPLKLLIYHFFESNTFYVHLFLVLVVVMASCHPINIWYQCKTGQIHNLTSCLEPQPSVTLMLMDKSVDGDKAERNNVNAGKDNKDKSGLQITDL